MTPLKYEIGAGLIFGAAAMSLWLYIGPGSLPTEIVEQHAPIAHAGEWVTHPNGQKVCRLRSDIFYGQVMEASNCDDWAERIPFRGQLVDWLRMRTGGGGQINIDGEWRP